MSLASLVANLFSPESPRTTPNRTGFGIVDDGESAGSSFVDVKLRTEGLGSNTMASEALEEEGRPPYLLVREMFVKQSSC